MRNDHHFFHHAFPITMWVFLSPLGNTSKLGLDLDGTTFLVHCGPPILGIQIVISNKK
jgi:hypothetical protein